MELMLFIQWAFWAFTAGVFAGGLLLGFGFLLGKLHSKSTDKQVKDEPFDPTEEVMDDKFFEEQWKSEDDTEVTAGGEFPSDEILEELDRLHRHSEF
jgi:hypothetical protein